MFAWKKKSNTWSAKNAIANMGGLASSSSSRSFACTRHHLSTSAVHAASLAAAPDAIFKTFWSLGSVGSGTAQKLMQTTNRGYHRGSHENRPANWVACVVSMTPILR